MNSFTLHEADALYLFVMAAGAALYVLGIYINEKDSKVAKFFGAIILIFSIAGIVCHTFFGIEFFGQGVENPRSGTQHMGDHFDMSMKTGEPMMTGDHSNAEKKSE